MARAESVSVTVLDRNNELLRAYTTDDERWRLPVSVDELNLDDLRPGDVGGTRAWTDRVGHFCLPLSPSKRYLGVVVAPNRRPAAAIFESGSLFAIAVLADGPEFRWGL